VFVRRVKTASGATAVQIVRKRGRRVLGIEHIGSAHTDDELAVLMQVADERRHAGQLALDLDDAGEAVAGKAAVVEGTSSLILWEVLAGIYGDLGLDRLGDDTFRALVLARVIEPTSKLDTVRVLAEVGVASPHRVTFMRCLKRVVDRGYRGLIAQACCARAIRAFKGAQHDNRAINAMVERAEKVAAGQRPLKKDRFVAFTDTSTNVDRDLVERARSLAGIKGYVTNIDPAVMDGAAVVAAYHDLYQVERSFRMTKSDLAARPIFHRLQDSIQAHLTVVFAALAISREAQARSGRSINKIVKSLRPLRSATITIGTQQVTAQPRIPAETRSLLNDLRWSGH